MNKQSEFGSLTHSVEIYNQNNLNSNNNNSNVVNKSIFNQCTFCLLQKDTVDSEESFTLKTQYSNCTDVQEITIKSFILQKIFKNSVYKTGSFGVLNEQQQQSDNNNNDKIQSCFYTLIEVPLEGTSIVSPKSTSNSNIDLDLNLDLDLDLDEGIDSVGLELDLNFSPNLKSIEDLINDKDIEDDDEFMKKLDDNDNLTINNNTNKNLEYYLCLVCEIDSDVNLGMFHLEFSYFCEILSNLLKLKKSNRHNNLGEIGVESYEEKIKNHLENWEYLCIEYISRSVRLLNDSLHLLIHSILNGYSFKLNYNNSNNNNNNENKCIDIIMFLKTLSFVNLKITKSNENDTMISYLIESSESNSIPGERNIIEIGIHEDNPIQIENYTDSNQFCKKWSIKYQDNQENQLLLRSFSEDIKLRVIQELNMFRRMIDFSKMNNYLLYKSLLFLLSNDNSDILLNLFQKDIVNQNNNNNTENDQSVNDIIIILKNQIQKSIPSNSNKIKLI